MHVHNVHNTYKASRSFDDRNRTTTLVTVCWADGTTEEAAAHVLEDLPIATEGGTVHIHMYMYIMYIIFIYIYIYVYIHMHMYV